MRRFWPAIVWSAVLAVVLAVQALSAVIAKDKPLPPIGVRVNPRIIVSATMQKVTIEVLIPRNPDNRAFCILVDGPGTYQTSCQDLNGQDEPAVFTQATVGFGEDGEYLVGAMLYTKQSGPSKPAYTVTDKVIVGAREASLVGN